MRRHGMSARRRRRLGTRQEGDSLGHGTCRSSFLEPPGQSFLRVARPHIGKGPWKLIGIGGHLAMSPLLAPLTDTERRDLLEIIQDQSERASPLIASQLLPIAWHAAIGEPSVADAICDRVIHRAHRLTLKGATMRDPGTRRSPKGTS
jgi:hypothetical protein